MINKASIYSLIVNKTINFEKRWIDEYENERKIITLKRKKKEKKKKQFDTKDTLLVKLYWNYIDLCFTY